MKKCRWLGFLMALIMVLTLMPAQAVRADAPLSNVSITGDILSWDEFIFEETQSAAAYKYTVGTESGLVTDLQLDLFKVCQDAGFESGTYTVTLAALFSADIDETPISDTWTGSYEYTAPAAVTEYPVWVGDTQATSKNKDDILDDGGSAAFDPETNTLTLASPVVTGFGPYSEEDVGIYADGIDLTVKGTVTLSGGDIGIMVTGGKLIIDGNVTTHTDSHGLEAPHVVIQGGTVEVNGIRALELVNDETLIGSITISGGTVIVDSWYVGISSADTITISGGNVTASCLTDNAIRAVGDMTISGGTVVAYSPKVQSLNSYGTLTITNGVTSVAATTESGLTAVYGDHILIGDDLMIKKPEDGEVGTGLGEFAYGEVIFEAGGTVQAKDVLIVHKEDLPNVIGFNVNVTGTQENGGNYDVSTDTLETLFESSTAPVTMEVSSLYTAASCQLEDLLTTEPVAGTPYYFYVAAIAYDDADPATLTWADNDTIKTGSTFTADNGTVELVEIAHSPQGGSITLICKYTENASEPPITPTPKHTVTFDANGHGTAPAAQTVEDGKTAAKPADPAESGWIFGGWYKEAACTNSYDFSAPVTGDITLYAKWTEETPEPEPEPPTKYTISYDLNGGTLDGKTGTVVISVEENTVITLPKPTRTGYTFDYWKGSKYEAGAAYKVEGDHTFTAQWKPKVTPTNPMPTKKPTSTPKPTRTPRNPGGTPGSTPRTGDESQPWLWIALMAVALIGMGGALFISKKNKK